LLILKYLVVLGALINLFGSIPYIIGTLKGTTKPNRISWGLWSVAPLIASIAAFSSGVRWAVLPVFMSGFMPLIVFLASFANKKAYWKLEKFDYLCGIFSLLALVLWWITKQPVIAIIFAIISDLFAGIPTLIKGWRHPETESGLVYVAGLLSSLTALAAVTAWNFSEYGFAVYLIIMNTLLFSAVYHVRFARFFKSLS